MGMDLISNVIEGARRNESADTKLSKLSTYSHTG